MVLQLPRLVILFSKNVLPILKRKGIGTVYIATIVTHICCSDIEEKALCHHSPSKEETQLKIFFEMGNGVTSQKKKMLRHVPNSTFS